MSLISGDGVERRILEGFFEMLDGGLGGSLGAIAGGLLRRRGKSHELGSNGRLCLEKSFPDSISCRIAQRAPECLECPGFVARCWGLLKELPEALRVDEQTLDLVRDPDAEGSATAVCAATIAAKDP